VRRLVVEGRWRTGNGRLDRKSGQPLTRAIGTGTALRLCVSTRWDALELMDALRPYHPFLVQRAPSIWEIHGHAQGGWNDALPDLYERVSRVLVKRRVDSVEISFGDGAAVVIRHRAEGAHAPSRTSLEMRRRPGEAMDEWPAA